MNFTREEVYQKTLKYFGGDTLATDAWINKYCLKNRDEYFEQTPDEMHRRLAKEFARIESKYPNPMDEEQIYQLLKDFKYLVPQGSPMAGIGNSLTATSISNCFVIGDHPDSYGGIMRADEEEAQLMKRRGGVGQDISHIRPSGAIANGSPLGPKAGTILYMNRFSNTTREVQQDGRRGALMLSISINHPDSEGFIDAKMAEGQITGANVSVKITNEFMRCVREGLNFYQTFPTHHSVQKVSELSDEQLGSLEINKLYEGVLIDGVKTYYKRVDPIVIWQKIVYNAWKSAEPGILFWDQILEECTASGYGLSWIPTSTNPCGEIPLCPYDSCRLLAINLFSYICNAFLPNAMLEDKLLTNHIHKAMRLMDDIVDLEIEKIDAILADIASRNYTEDFAQVEINLWKKIRQKAVDGRRTGLGILGEGDLIAAIGYKYGTPEATRFAEVLHQLIATEAYRASIQLAKERGAFPIYHHSKEEGNFLKRMFHKNVMMEKEDWEDFCKYGRRNIGLLTIAPTGTTSLMTQTTSGIEPLFFPFYYRKRKVLEGEKFDFVDSIGDKFEEYVVIHKPFIMWYAAEAQVDFDVAKYQLQKLDKDKMQELFEASPYFKATAQDVDYVEKVRMQGAVQKWIDHSISVTVNMPENVTVDVVNDVYMQAWESGCKGITVYRDNSRSNVLSTGSLKVGNVENFDYVSAIKRPKKVECDVFLRSSRKDNFIIFVGIIDGRPYEMFAIPHTQKTSLPASVKRGTIEKISSGHYRFESEDKMYALSNLIDYMIENEQQETRNVSAMLRHRIDPKYIVDDVIEQYATISSFHKAIGKVLRTYVINDSSNDICSKCGEKLQFTDGCLKCPGCGESKCG